MSHQKMSMHSTEGGKSIVNTLLFVMLYVRASHFRFVRVHLVVNEVFLCMKGISWVLLGCNFGANVYNGARVG